MSLLVSYDTNKTNSSQAYIHELSQRISIPVTMLAKAAFPLINSTNLLQCELKVITNNDLCTCVGQGEIQPCLNITTISGCYAKTVTFVLKSLFALLKGKVENLIKCKHANY